ncbi:hypothetical protein KEJ18_06190 [Candidatus Bathyarchaeota archaeon]|nr:hypothetical protein [Candidatus Bathyarchaeota archaeon]
MVFQQRLLPDSALKVVLSGLLNSTWGSFNRSTIVRFFVYGNNVKIGVGEGSIHQWEIEALKDSPIRHEWFRLEHLDETYVEGIKYVPGGKVSGMPQELIPVKSRDIKIFYDETIHGLFSAYRCFDINFENGRILSIIGQRSIIKDVVETVHPAFPNHKYHGRVNNVEVDAKILSHFIKKGYGIGILRRKGSIKIEKVMEGFPILGISDIMEVSYSLKAKGFTLDL